MITKSSYFNAECIPEDMIGLSTDAKPTDVANASTFYEMDTRKMFMFDAEHRRWISQYGGGATINNQDMTITENGTYTADEGYTGLGTVTVEVAGAGGDGIDHGIEEYFAGRTTELNSNSITFLKNNAFAGNGGLTSVYLPKLVEVGAMGRIFANCSDLETVSFPELTRVANSMFSGCAKLKNVSLPKANVFESSAFSGCTALVSLELPMAEELNGAFITAQGMSHIDINIEKLKLPMMKTLSDSDLTSLGNLKTLDLGSCESFQGVAKCQSLTALIIRTDGICECPSSFAPFGCYHLQGVTNSTYNPDGLKDGYVYVPRKWLSDEDETKDYRRATNWSTINTQFRALEDYTVDGTVTGELDESKIAA